LANNPSFLLKQSKRSILLASIQNCSRKKMRVTTKRRPMYKCKFS